MVMTYVTKWKNVVKSIDNDFISVEVTEISHRNNYHY